jgi:hypothetical protein
MCKNCHKEKTCHVACVSLMRVPKKDLTLEEVKRVRSYESMANDQNGY